MLVRQGKIDDASPVWGRGVFRAPRNRRADCEISMMLSGNGAIFLFDRGGGGYTETA